jgi:hypothetical protein
MCTGFTVTPHFWHRCNDMWGVQSPGPNGRSAPEYCVWPGAR